MRTLANKQPHWAMYFIFFMILTVFVEHVSPLSATTLLFSVSFLQILKHIGDVLRREPSLETWRH